jgi:DNA mismatch repair protein MutS
VVCVVLEEIKQSYGAPLMFAGMAAADLTTGTVYVHEAISANMDDKFALDECNRFITSLNPMELVVYIDGLIKTKEEFISYYLELDNKFHHFNNVTHKKYSTLKFQNEVLEKSYVDNKSVVSVIEQLDLEKFLYATKALVILIDFCADHQQSAIHKLSPPIFFSNSKSVVLGNNAQYQLNIIESDTYDSKGRIKSLLDVVNKASTSMGKRFVKNRLMFPLVNTHDLNKIYNIVDIFIKKNKWKKIDVYLSNINDIERLERKMCLLTLQPYEMFYFIESLRSSCDLFTYMNKNKRLKKVYGAEFKDDVEKMLEECDKVFDYDALKLSNISKEIKSSFILEGVDSELDAISTQMSSSDNIFNILCSKLSEMINDNNGKYKKVQVQTNKTDGHYLSCTKIRGESIEDYIKQHKIKQIKINKHTSVKTDKIAFQYLKGTCKIRISSLSDKSDDVEQCILQLSDRIVKVYRDFLSRFYMDWTDKLKHIISAVTYLDYYKTIAKVSIENHYTRPIIESDRDCGYLYAKELRHPIVESIIDHEYVPHDIEMGDKLKGVLIYGLNSAGKSVLMKAVGLGIIMAQAGFFVPAKEFKFSPYHAIYTRITGTDNLFKGLSSYALEMVELNAILKRSDPRTLVLGDEVCRGTEHISGNAIVASTLMHLSNTESSFIFATHLHEIAQLPQITSLANIKSFHLSVNYDSESDQLVYDRQLKEGPGDRIYGILVAKSIISNEKFINDAINIKNQLLEKSDGIMTEKTSHYNKGKYVDKCEICSGTKKLETHHINFQKDFDKDGYHKNKFHIKKNALYNLMTLCEQCHDMIHNSTITIDSTKMTSKGKKVIISSSEQKSKK